MNDDSFGAKFRAARQSAPSRVTLSMVGQLLGKSVSYISDVENDRRRLTPEAITQVCEGLFKADPAPLVAAAQASGSHLFRIKANDARRAELLAGMARNINQLSPEQIDELMRVIGGFPVPRWYPARTPSGRVVGRCRPSSSPRETI